MPTIQKETARAILGVEGRAHSVVTWAGRGNPNAPDEIANQKWVSLPRRVDASEWGANARIRVNIRFDDSCKNGKKSFGIGADIYRPGARDVEACGCLHDEIEKYFPELRPLIQWHLFDQTGPMHYPANAIYLASNRDAWGRAPGDVSKWGHVVRFSDVPISHSIPANFWEWLQEYGPRSGFDFEVLNLSEQKDGRTYSGFTFGGFPYADAWHKCPFKSERAASEFLAALKNCNPTFDRIPLEYSEGKERELDAARRAAKWPDAPDSVLMSDKEALKAALLERLPDMVAGFKRAMIEDCGFVWDATGKGGAA